MDMMRNLDRSKFELKDLEQVLYASMQPVKPRQEFIRQLRSRLSEPVNVSLPRQRIEKSHYLLFGLATLLSGIFILFTTSRMILVFLGAIGLARYLKNQTEQKQLSTQRVIG